MHAISLPGWENFFMASAGAAAALAGLLFVALSINLSQVLKIPGMTARAGESFLPLGVTLVVSLLAIVPDQKIGGFAVELICLGGGTWLVSSAIQIRAVRNRHFAKAWHLCLRLSINQSANLTVLIAGLSLERGLPGGLYWLIPAVLMAFLGAMVNAWIMLVEILR
jgi:hypothetical protein